MDIVLIVVAGWIALDIAIIAALSHMTRRRREIVTGPRSLAPPAAVPSRPVSPRPVHSPMRLRLVGDPSGPAPEHRLRAVSHR